MNLFDTLTQLTADAANDIPALISAAGLKAFNVFKIGQSRKAEDIGFFVYQSILKYNYSLDQKGIIYQLQLPGISAEDTAKYIDEVFGWVKGYDFQRIEMTLLENTDIITWPNAQDRSTIVFFDLTIREDLDSCNDND